MINEEMDFTNVQMLRSKAEELLKKKQNNNAIPDNEIDIKKLVHELQVHQIELEMQNEELRHAYVTSEAALKKYTMLFDLSMMGYFTLDEDGTICDLNFAGADMLGKRRYSLINSNFKLYVSEESRPVFNNFFSKIYTSNTKEWCEIVLRNDKNLPCHVYIEGVTSVNEPVCLLTLVDISKLNRRINEQSDL
ncbi:MAG TPA: PAS domain-containing protein [Draconibacterium sp.]|nr:PAS domain-containing protein [Draconibacterium sp.]